MIEYYARWTVERACQVSLGACLGNDECPGSVLVGKRTGKEAQGPMQEATVQEFMEAVERACPVPGGPARRISRICCAGEKKIRDFGEMAKNAPSGGTSESTAGAAWRGGAARRSGATAGRAHRVQGQAGALGAVPRRGLGGVPGLAVAREPRQVDGLKQTARANNRAGAIASKS
eukprot:scaffold36556_cov62-Phaeocystis_antarctica.AAC.5